MRAAFADTLYWVAFANPSDQWHPQAVMICQDQQITRLVTTDEILAEFLTQFSSMGPRLRLKAVALVEAILADPSVQVIPRSRDSFQAGLKLYESRPDKGNSLADCVSMNSMRALGLTDALTFDEHFVQKGFRALFRT